MAINDALFSVTAYVATQPKKGVTKSGTKTLTFRIGWTPRELSRETGEWADVPSSFASVTCYRKIAENAACCLREGDPIVLKGTLRVREYADQAGTRRNSVDVVADFLGHDLARGTSNFSKHSPRTQQTAEEYELSQAAGGHRLPGDLETAQWQDEQQLEAIETDELVPADGAEALPDDRDDLEPATAVARPDDDTDDIDDDGSNGSVLAEPGWSAESAESRATARGGRYRKAEPVGAGV
jgi:single-strand DNA-binding protein